MEKREHYKACRLADCCIYTVHHITSVESLSHFLLFTSRELARDRVGSRSRLGSSIRRSRSSQQELELFKLVPEGEGEGEVPLPETRRDERRRGDELECEATYSNLDIST